MRVSQGHVHPAYLCVALSCFSMFTCIPRVRFMYIYFRICITSRKKRRFIRILRDFSLCDSYHANQSFVFVSSFAPKIYAPQARRGAQKLREDLFDQWSTFSYLSRNQAPNIVDCVTRTHDDMSKPSSYSGLRSALPLPPTLHSNFAGFFFSSSHTTPTHFVKFVTTLYFATVL